MRLEKSIELYNNKVLTYLQRDDVFQTMDDIQLNELVPKGTILTVKFIEADNISVNAVMTDRKNVEHTFTTHYFLGLRKIN